MWCFVLQSSVGFDDLAASFSKEEWMELEEWQKELYRNVMKETSETLISLGKTHHPVVKPAALCLGGLH